MTSTLDSLDTGHLLAQEGFVRALARGLLFDEHEVDDVVQQTWLQALRRPPASSPGLRGWLAIAVRGHAIKYRRAATRRRRREEQVARSEAIAPAAEILEREEQRRQLVDAARRLGEPYRTAILLRYFEGLPPRKIAARLGVPLATVKTRLKRALGQLREQLDASHGGDRRAWSLAMVPLALPVRTPGVLALTASWLGFLMAFKLYVLTFTLVAAGLALWLSLSAAGRGEPHGTEHEALVSAAATAADVDAPTLAGGVAASADAGDRRVTPDDTPDTDAEAPSVLAALGGVRGRLVLPDGKPAAGELVRLLSFDALESLGGAADPFGARRPRAGLRHSKARSGADGSFRIDRVWPGSLHALHAGVDGDHAVLRMLTQTIGAEGEIDLGTIHLPERARLEGRVVDGDGRPVAGADVLAAALPSAVASLVPLEQIRPGGAMLLAVPPLGPRPALDPASLGRHNSALRKMLGAWIPRAGEGAEFVVLPYPDWVESLHRTLPLARAKTAADGRFTLRGVAPGRLTVIASKDGIGRYLRGALRVGPGAERDLGDVRLRGAADLRGSVVDANGEPVPSAELRVAARSGMMTAWAFAGPVRSVDARGRFRFTGLQRGELLVAARRDAAAPWRVHGPFDGGDEVKIELETTAGVAIELVSATGDSVEDVTWLLRRGVPLGEIDAAGFSPPIDLASRLTSRDGVHRIADLPPGTYTLAVGAARHAPKVCAFVAGRDASLRVELQPSAPLSLRVVDGGGRPVHGARVYAQSTEASGWDGSVLHLFRDLGRWERLARALGRTGRDGSLEVDGLAQNEHLVVVWHPAFGRHVRKVRLPAAPLVVELAEAATIEGRVIAGGEPASASQVRIAAQQRPEHGEPPFVGQARLLPDGRYRIAGLAPGTYSLFVREPIDALDGFGAVLTKIGKPDFRLFEPKVVIALRPGETRQLDLDATPGRRLSARGAVGLAGRVRVDGQPIAGAKIIRHDSVVLTRYADPDAAIATTDSNGRFTAAGLPPATHDIAVRGVLPGASRPTVMWRGEVTLPQSGQGELDLELRTGFARVFVRDSAGKPVAANVTLSGRNHAGAECAVWGGKSDADGVFHERVPAGRYRIEVDGIDVPARGEGAVEVDIGAIGRGEVWLSTRGVIAGRIANPDGLPVRYLELKYTVPGTQMTQTISIDERGRFRGTTWLTGTFVPSFYAPNGERYRCVPAEFTVGDEGRVDLELRVTR